MQNTGKGRRFMVRNGLEKDSEMIRVFRRQQQASAWAEELKQAGIAVSKFIC